MLQLGMTKLKLAYFGTPSFSATFLEQLIENQELPVEVILVVTQPDKPVGRKQIMTASPVKKVARKFHIPVIEDIKSFYASRLPAGKAGFTLHGLDLAVLYAYGAILPKEALDIPRLGFFNIHPSLLPLYRGPSPMAYPLIMGDAKTGVTLMKMDEKMDHGPILSQQEIKISLSDKRPDIEIKLTNLGYALLKKALEKLPDVNTSRQNHSRTTYTRILTKADGYIALNLLKKSLQGELLNYRELPELIRGYLEKYQNRENQIHRLKFAHYNLYRGLFPWPGIWTKVKINSIEKRLKIADVKLENDRLVITKIQLEGKNEVDFETFNKAYSLF